MGFNPFDINNFKVSEYVDTMNKLTDTTNPAEVDIVTKDESGKIVTKKVPNLAKKVSELNSKLDQVEKIKTNIYKAVEQSGKDIKISMKPDFDSGWHDFQKAPTGGKNYGGISIFDLGFEPLLFNVLVKYKSTGHTFTVASISSNQDPKGKNDDLGAIVIVKGNKLSVGFGEGGVRLGEATTIFRDNEGADTFGENDDNVKKATDFHVRVVAWNINK